jgi:hypothetical protein
MEQHGSSGNDVKRNRKKKGPFEFPQMPRYVHYANRCASAKEYNEIIRQGSLRNSEIVCPFSLF